MSYLNQLLFGYYPYIAGSVFLIGSLIRFDREQYSWRSGSSQLLSGKSLYLASNLFHIGILALFAGHLVGLLTPHELYGALGMTAAFKQKLAMTAGGIFGLCCFVGMTLLVKRRLTEARIRNTSADSDIFILLLLYAQLILGLFTIPVSAGHMDGSVMMMLAEWAQRIVTFRGGAAEAIAHVSIIYKAHLFLGLTMFLVFPFTRLVHIWSAPIWYIGRSYQIVRRR